jgi:pimeloyl-ACP methyl ester carboxylesterase
MVSHQTRIFIGVLCVASLFGSFTYSQDSEIEITRNDLALSLMRLETVLKEVELSDEETARINKAFDQATLKFFARQYGPAIQGINEVTISVHPKADKQEAKIYYSLRTRILPLVFIKGTKVQPMVSIESLYPDPLDGEDRVVAGNLVIKNANGKVEFRVPYELDIGPDNPVNAKIRMVVDKNHFDPHQYQIGFEAKSGTHYDTSKWTVVPKSLDVVSAANRDKFSTIGMGDFHIEQAITTVLERNKLITDAPSLEKSSEFLIDPNTLVKEVDNEINQLARKKGQTNPYDRRRGDYWRVLKVKGKDPIPLRVYLPESANLRRPLPLVIAFHGAGGDENMFMDAYGVGRIKELADQHGFLLVTPLTYSFSGENMGPYFDLLMKVITHDYPVDESRVYALGHSMGGGATSSLTSIRGDKLAAVAPLCGYRAITSAPENTPPILAYAAEFDPLAQPSRIEAEVKKTREAGNEIEYRLMKNWGHTLVVGKILPDVVEWLLQHKL